MSEDRTFVKREHFRMTERDIISSFCSGAPRPRADERQHQMDAYKSGRALAGHVKDAHNGVEDPKCNACKEIRFRCGM